MEFVGARNDAKGEGLDLQPGISSYFIGNDSRKWRAGISHYAKVRYRNVYRGIDLIYYGDSAGRLEYDFVVSPGADPSIIQIAYNQRIRWQASGDLLIAGVRQRRPRVFQGAREIACHYRRANSADSVGIELAEYDHSLVLIIDPVLEYSTYLGGPAFESGSGIQVDAQGNIYMSMLERSPANPSLNPFQQSSGSSYAAFVIKFAPDGKSILYYAYVGGSADTYVNSLAIDSSGNTYLTGETSAFDLPVKNAFQPVYGGGFFDGFVAKLSSDGRSILYCTYLGGGNNDGGTTIVVDGSGRAYIGGYTYSHDFPIANALQPQALGSDAFLTRLSADGKTLDVSTYYGGTGISTVNGIALDSAGYIYLTGKAGAADFPLKSAFQTSAAGGFAAKLTPAADAIVYSSFIGDLNAIGWGIAVDNSGSAIVSGTTGGQFNTINAFQASFAGGPYDLFLAKVRPDGSGLVFATYLGGSGWDYQNQNALALDTGGNAYITGWTFSTDFPLQNSLQSSTAGGQAADAIVAEFSSSGSLVFSTVLGGHADNRGGAIAVDETGAVYVSGSTYSADFPLVSPFQSTYGGAGDAIMFKLGPSALTTSPLNISPSALQFTYIVGTPPPAAQSVSITSSTPGISFTPSSSAPWLKAPNTAQITPAMISISVDPTGLTPAQYPGSVRLDSQTSVPVTLTVQNAAPVLSSITPATVAVGTNGATISLSGSGFLTGATVLLNGQPLQSGVTILNSTTIQVSLQASVLAQSGILSFTVQNPSSALSNALTLAIGVPPPEIDAITNAASYQAGPISPGEIVTLFGANLTNNVTFDGAPAILVYFSPTQVNITVPYSVTAPSTILTMGSASMQVQVVSSAPGIFAGVPVGNGIVTLYGTGCGTLTTDALPLCSLPSSVSVNGERAQVLYAGIAPSLVAGVDQINFVLPSDIQSGTVSIVWTVAGKSSQPYLLTIP